MKPGVCAPPPTEPARVENFMPQGVIPGVVAVHGHDAVAHGQDRTLMASKQPHEVIGVFHHGVGVEPFDVLCDELYSELVDARPLALGVVHRRSP